jgi:hypothetical protein
MQISCLVLGKTWACWMLADMLSLVISAAIDSRGNGERNYLGREER